MAFDLDKLIAEREAVTPFTFKFDDHEYTMPSDIDVEVLEWFARGEIAAGLEELLGAEQWGAIVDSPKVLGAVAMGELFEAYTRHLGVDNVGESLASPRSLRSMARPSKPTSSATTESPSPSSDEASPGGG